MRNFKWINIFIRDILLVAVIFWINHTLNYRSFVAAMLVGMMVVLVTWHLSDFIKLNRRLSNGVYGSDGNISSSDGVVYNSLQQDKESGTKRYARRD